MSLIKTEKKGKNEIEFEIAADAKAFDDACNKAYRRNVKKIVVPGFRAGKAPRKIIEKRFGEKIFYDDAIEILYPKLLQDAIEESELEVIAVDSLEPLKADLKDGLTLKALCILKPKITIENYKGMKAQKNVKNVTKKLIQEELEKMRERGARVLPVEDRAAKKGDTVIFDFDGYVDGKPFEGGKAEKYTLKLGSGQFISGFEEQIEGKNINEDFEVNVTFPKDYHVEELKDKPSIFKCKIHEIQTTQLPELDDEFAKDVSEFDTLDELMEDIKRKKKEEFKIEAGQAFEDALSKQLIELVKGEIPEVMYEQKIDDLIQNFATRLSSQGMSLELYMKYTGMDKKGLREQFKQQATHYVKLRLALEKIAELENLKIEEKEIENKYQEMAEKYQMKAEKIKSFISEKDLKKDMLAERAMELVKKEADTTTAKTSKTAEKKENPIKAKK